MPHVKAVSAAFLERTPFAIDGVGDDEDDSDLDLVHGEDDDQVMDEVSHDYFKFWNTSSLPCVLRSMLSWRQMIRDCRKLTKRSRKVRVYFVLPPQPCHPPIPDLLNAKPI